MHIEYSGIRDIAFENARGIISYIQEKHSKSVPVSKNENACKKSVEQEKSR